ncbi:heme-binding domain-containing protein [Maribellus sediminis]|uniref:heme-binding domain-containing protein n=1 Tax=Maribellus sediminis TaxID=2696285 RepID=UPI001430A8AC|nr:heme-binding domain-containing protein [Maribellus sediminis]
MKTKITLNLLFLGLFTLSAAASDTEKSTYYSPAQMSEEVKAVVQNKCFGCHNTDSKNDKAKEDLDFKTFDTLTNLKKVSAYKKIGDVLNENEMPPKKFLDHYPDKKLTDAEKKLLMDWAKAEAEKLVKGM